jgi:hypothetical protein
MFDTLVSVEPEDSNRCYSGSPLDKILRYLRRMGQIGTTCGERKWWLNTFVSMIIILQSATAIGSYL